MKPILRHLGLVTVGDNQAWAVTSKDDRHRYLLGRIWNPHLPYWLYCMINPSTARGVVFRAGVRHENNDATIRKCIGFAERGNAGGILVVNALAYSATHPEDMVRAHQIERVDVYGEHNDAAMTWALGMTGDGKRIAAWGKIPPKLRALAARGTSKFLERNPECFGTNGDGTPKHPLMLPYSTPIVAFRKTEAA